MLGHTANYLNTVKTYYLEYGPGIGFNFDFRRVRVFHEPIVSLLADTVYLRQHISSALFNKTLDG